MGFLIGLLTFVMVLDCLVLIFLVLLQLPKKEAGAGLAFGAGATDALFGAGSGTVLTKITKYSAGIFFGLAIILSLLRTHYSNQDVSKFQQGFGQAPTPSGAAPRPAGAPPSSAPSTNVLTTNASTAIEATNVPATVTNAPAPK